MSISGTKAIAPYSGGLYFELAGMGQGFPSAFGASLGLQGGASVRPARRRETSLKSVLLFHARAMFLCPGCASSVAARRDGQGRPDLA